MRGTDIRKNERVSLLSIVLFSTEGSTEGEKLKGIERDERDSETSATQRLTKSPPPDSYSSSFQPNSPDF